MFQTKDIGNGMHQSNLIERVFAFWLKRYKLIFFLIFFSVCLAGGFLWYYSLYYFHWTPEQKQAYSDEKSHRDTLNTKDFEEVLRSIDNRENIYHSNPVVVRNIFLTSPSVKK